MSRLSRFSYKFWNIVQNQHTPQFKKEKKFSPQFFTANRAYPSF